MSCRNHLLVFLAILFASACSDDTKQPPGHEAGVDGRVTADGSQTLPVCGMQGGTGTTLVSVSPADQEKKVLRMPRIQVKFSGELPCTASGVAPGSLKLMQGSTTIALSEIKCLGNPTLIKAQPLNELDYQTSYTLTVQGLVGDQQKPIPACQLTFSTKGKTAAVRAGDGYSLSLDEDGTLWSWGDTLGPLVSSARPGPADIPLKLDRGGKKVVAISSGVGSALAATEDGTVWAWGSNKYGQLGDGSTTDTTEDKAVKVKLTLPTGVTIKEVSAGEVHALALRSDGKVMAWGDNQKGQLGDGSTASHAVPIEVPGLSDVVAIGAGRGNTEGYWSLVAKADGTVWAWGSNRAGQLGAYPGPDSPNPMKIGSLSGIKTVAAGYDIGFALGTDGKLWAWGETLYGGLGVGGCHNGPLTAPQQVPLTNIVSSISASGNRAMAVKTDGTVWGWGWNGQGQVGDGTLGQTVVCNPNFTDENIQQGPKQATGVSNAVQISVGPAFNMIVNSNGSVWGVGSNTNDSAGLGDAPKFTNTDIVVLYAPVLGL